MVKIWKILLVAVLVLAAVKLAYFNINSNNYYWDEAVYLDIAQNIKSQGSYFSSDGENYRAPLLPLLLAFMPNLDAAHLSVVIISLISMLLAYLLGKEVLNRYAGLAAAIFIGINPLYYFWSYKLLTEPIALCLIILSLYMFIKFEKQEDPKFLYLSSFSAGLAIMARYTSISLALALAVALLLKGKPFRKQNLIAAAILLLTIAPLFWLGIMHYGNPIGMPLWNSIATSSPHMPISSFALRLFDNFTPYVFVLFALAIILPIRKKVPKVIWLYLLITLAMLMSVSQKYERFLIILLPAYALIAAVAFADISKKLEKLQYIFLIFIFMMAAYTVQYNIADLKAESGNTEILLNAADYVKDSECTSIITNSTKHFGYFSGKKVVEYPGSIDELTSIVNSEESPCIAVDSFHGITSYRNFINDTYKLVYTNSSDNRFVQVYTP